MPDGRLGRFSDQTLHVQVILSMLCKLVPACPFDAPSRLDLKQFWNHQHIIAWLYYRPLGHGEFAVAGLVNLVLFDRRVMDHLLDCSRDVLQLRSVHASQIGVLHKTFSDQGIFFQRESELTRVLGSFLAAKDNADSKRNVVKTISTVANLDAFVVWYDHIGQGLPPGRYLLLLRKDLHSPERTGVVSAFPRH